MLLVLAGCGAPAPTRPTSTTPPQSPPPPTQLITGKVSDALDGRPIQGASVESYLGAAAATTNVDGHFAVTAAGVFPFRISIKHSDYVERLTWARQSDPQPTVTMIPRTFNLEAFDEAWRGPNGTRRWMEAPALVVILSTAIGTILYRPDREGAVAEPLPLDVIASKSHRTVACPFCSPSPVAHHPVARCGPKDG